MNFIDKLESMHACREACEWVGGKSLEEAWETCERGDWMLWLAVKAGVDRKKVVLAACECARLSLKYIPEEEIRPLRAIEMAEAWADDKVSIKEVKQAAYAAYAAANATHATNAAYAAAYAVYAATYTAYASNATAKAAYAAYAAANAADAAADAAYAAAARKSTLKKCADIVRKRILVEDIEEAMRAV